MYVPSGAMNTTGQSTEHETFERSLKKKREVMSFVLGKVMPNKEAMKWSQHQEKSVLAFCFLFQVATYFTPIFNH